MRVFLGALLAFIFGVILVYAVVVAGALWYVHANNILDRDGGLSMGIMFLIGPACALLGGTVAATATAVRIARRERARAAGERPPPKPWPLPALIVGSLLAGAFAYFAVWAMLWAGGPLQFSSYWAALAVSLSPIVMAVVVAGLIAWRGLRNRTRST